MLDKDKIKKLLEEIDKLSDGVCKSYGDAQGWLLSSYEDNHIEQGLLDSIYYLDEKLDKVIELVKEAIKNEQ